MLVWKIIAAIAAYFVGAINMATIVGKLKGKNIKKMGSGNPGTMNVLRSVGKLWGALTFAFDCAKGVAFALIGRFAIDGGSTDWMMILGTICVIGHIFPIYTKLRGGKGVATSLGVFMVAIPIVGACVLVGLIIYLLLCKIGFIGSYLAITALTIANCVWYRDSVIVILMSLVIWTLVVIRHKDNVIRLLKGKENTLSLVGKNKAADADAEAQPEDIKDIDGNNDGENAVKEQTADVEDNVETESSENLEKDN